jgi:hypothetical protein
VLNPIESSQESSGSAALSQAFVMRLSVGGLHKQSLADDRIGRDERALLFTLARPASNTRYKRCIARAISTRKSIFTVL